MSKATELIIKIKHPEAGDVIEVETIMGWERVEICMTQGEPAYKIGVRFDDGSERRDIIVDDINWRRVVRAK